MIPLSPFKGPEESPVGHVAEPGSLRLHGFVAWPALVSAIGISDNGAFTLFVGGRDPLGLAAIVWLVARTFTPPKNVSKTGRWLGRPLLRHRT